MASVIDSMRTIITAKHAFLKLFILSGLFAYPAYQIAFVKFEGWATLWPIITIFLLIYNIGFIINTVHNEVNDRSVLVPGVLNPLQFVAVGLGTLLTIAPIVALMIYSGTALYNLGVSKNLPDAYTITVISLVEIIFYVFFIVQIMLFSHKFNPFLSFNVITIFKNFSDVLFKTISLIFVILFVSIFTFIPVGILMVKMFGMQSYGFLYYATLVVMLILMIMLYFYGQVYMENLVANLEINYDEGVEDIVDKDKKI